MRKAASNIAGVWVLAQYSPACCQVVGDSAAPGAKPEASDHTGSKPSFRPEIERLD